ncbi:hypothetical protein CTI12_AA070750 [Artemisia annua]|uniref:Disease resistance N-terminal domain-containing protein n=1 Tax=Artemisia annua TaxID=35608 RepID=A0A2U1PE12_ARTAN|nr:hypothetical protein CTI12_AA070750 [Artemisia annua]
METALLAPVMIMACLLIGKEIAIAWGFKDDLSILLANLEMVQARLSDANGQNGPATVWVWVKQLQKVVSEAECLLEEV